MTTSSRWRRNIAACIAVAVLVGLMTAVASGLVFPEPIPSGALGPDWQCTRLAFVFTSCIRGAGLKTTAVEGDGPPACRRPAAWLDAFGFLR